MYGMGLCLVTRLNSLRGGGGGRYEMRSEEETKIPSDYLLWKYENGFKLEIIV